MSQNLRIYINKLAGKFGIRLVNRNWGPREFMVSFEDLKKRGFLPEVVYDVGASDGSWSQELKELLVDSEFVLFEPLPKYSEILGGLEQSGNTYRYMGCGLGSNTAELEFNSHDGQSSFLSSQQWKGDVIRVPVRTIDDLVRSSECLCPDLIKADIQGFEIEMLKGAEETLKKCSFLFLEVSWIQIYEGGPAAGEVIGYLAARGFHVYDISSYSQRPYDRRLTQSDVLFAHERTGLFDEKVWS